MFLGGRISNFQKFFHQATGQQPYPYQEELAAQVIESRIIHAPTGAGKTAAATLSWLWQLQENPQTTPRRLIYCLPMRVLVEQTRDEAQRWLRNLGLERQVRLHVLMGGEEAGSWDCYPERPALLIGTQDMLLSRALNRGYAMSRFRWPVHYGLLHADSLWVFDEIQLMGAGLPTTAQLEAFCRKFSGPGGRCSWWMSATLETAWLKTPNFDPDYLPQTRLTERDFSDSRLRSIREASKPVEKASVFLADTAGVCKAVLDEHGSRGGLMLVIVNTVARAQKLYEELREAASVPLLLLHSRFRPQERAVQLERLTSYVRGEEGIVVSTQVVEAGVDLSARTLFTELAPWPSLVQRFGRCNRRGVDPQSRIFWLDLPEEEEEEEKFAAPYTLEELRTSRQILNQLEDASPCTLEKHGPKLEAPVSWVVRRKDLVELFDTTPDLAGNDLDIGRFVRASEQSEVRVFWRKWSGERPPQDIVPAPGELCPVPVKEFQEFVRKRRSAFRWDFLPGEWCSVQPQQIYSGQIYLLATTVGGYTLDEGWKGVKATEEVSELHLPPADSLESYEEDKLSETRWETIAEHTERVCEELNQILAQLNLPEAQLLRLAARWHDWGKAHPGFQAKIKEQCNGQSRPPEVQNAQIAKAPSSWWRRSRERTYFRHELASALAILQRPDTRLQQLPEDDLNLVAYLVAAHHGKVRLSIRSLPRERRPRDDRRFARGIWDGDLLPGADLGNGITAPAVTLSLEPMEIGRCESAPFAG